MKDFKSILEQNEDMVVNFSASWCGPCKMFAPIWEEVSGKHAADYFFLKIDVDECETLCAELNIASVPTTLVFKRGQEVKRRGGTFPTTKLFEDWLSQ